MVQSPGMGIRTFLANLRGQAALCKFLSKCNEPECSHTFDFSGEIVKDNLIRGISDPKILPDVLEDPKTDRILDEVVAFITQKEQGKATRSAEINTPERDPRQSRATVGLVVDRAMAPRTTRESE